MTFTELLKLADQAGLTSVVDVFGKELMQFATLIEQAERSKSNGIPTNRARELSNVLDRIADNVVELYPEQRDALHEVSRLLVFVDKDMLQALRDVVSASDANCGDSLANAINAARAVVANAKERT